MNKYILLLTLFTLLLAACNDEGYSSSNLALSSPEPSPSRAREACENFKPSGSYPSFKGVVNDHNFSNLGKSLAIKYVGLSEPWKTTDSKIIYQKAGKFLELKKDTFEISFHDEQRYEVPSSFSEKESIQTVREFLRENNLLGLPKDYYLVHASGGSFSQTASTEEGVSPITRDGYLVEIQREISGLPLLGGISAARFDVVNEGTLRSFRIKYIGIEQGDYSLAANQFLLPTSAKKEAIRTYKDIYKIDISEEDLSCELGYLPNSAKGIPDMIVPGYFIRREDERSLPLFIPATKEPKIVEAYAEMNKHDE